MRRQGPSYTPECWRKMTSTEERDTYDVVYSVECPELCPVMQCID